MTLGLQILLLLAGLALVVFGADWLVDGASSIARKVGISEFVIGLTIVGFGTSCPELVVSITGAIAGSSDISIGNVVGSNILNFLLILGLTAVLMPIGISRDNLKRDLPLCFFVTMLLIGSGHAHQNINRTEGIVFLILFIFYVYYCFKTDKPSLKIAGETNEETEKTLGTGLSIILVVAGLAGLIFGGRLFVNSATSIAKTIGVSEKFIAVTILAGGTSLPELATCIVAALKKRGQLALGNIIGSNIFNILLIIGISACIRPLEFTGMTLVDLCTMVLSVIIVWVGGLWGERKTLGRATGIVLLTTEAAYLTWLCLNL